MNTKEIHQKAFEEAILYVWRLWTPAAANLLAAICGVSAETVNAVALNRQWSEADAKIGARRGLAILRSSGEALFDTREDKEAFFAFVEEVEAEVTDLASSSYGRSIRAIGLIAHYGLDAAPEGWAAIALGCSGVDLEAAGLTLDAAELLRENPADWMQIKEMTR